MFLVNLHLDLIAWAGGGVVVGPRDLLDTHPTKEMIMTDAKAPDQGLKLADDDRVHTAQCVEEGWWLLDWDVDCVHVGVPQGGELGAYNERALFSVSLALLPLTAMASVRRDR